MAIAATNDTDVNIAVYDAAERAGDARQRRRRPLPLQLHPPGDRPHRAARDRDLDRRRLPRPGEADQARDLRARSARPTRSSPGSSTTSAAGRRATLPTYQDRKAFFEEIVNGDPDPIELLRSDRRDELAAVIAAARERHGEPRRGDAPSSRPPATHIRAHPRLDRCVVGGRPSSHGRRDANRAPPERANSQLGAQVSSPSASSGRSRGGSCSSSGFTRSRVRSLARGSGGSIRATPASMPGAGRARHRRGARRRPPLRRQGLRARRASPRSGGWSYCTGAPT